MRNSGGDCRPDRQQTVQISCISIKKERLLMLHHWLSKAPIQVIYAMQTLSWNWKRNVASWRTLPSFRNWISARASGIFTLRKKRALNSFKRLPGPVRIHTKTLRIAEQLCQFLKGDKRHSFRGKVVVGIKVPWWNFLQRKTLISYSIRNNQVFTLS